MQIQYSGLEGSDIARTNTIGNSDHVPYVAISEENDTVVSSKRSNNILKKLYNTWCCCCGCLSSPPPPYSTEGNNSDSIGVATNDKNSYTTNFLHSTDRTDIFEWIQDYEHVIDSLSFLVVFILQHIIAMHPSWIFESLWHVRLFAALLFGVPVYMCMITSPRTRQGTVVAACIAILLNIIFIPLYCLEQFRIQYTTTPSGTENNMSQSINATRILVYISLWFICVTFPIMLWHTIRNKSSLRRNNTPSFINGNSAIYYNPPSVV